MDQSGARCMPVNHVKSAERRLSIMSYEHGLEPIILHKLSQVFNNCNYPHKLMLPTHIINTTITLYLIPQ